MSETTLHEADRIIEDGEVDHKMVDDYYPGHTKIILYRLVKYQRTEDEPVGDVDPAFHARLFTSLDAAMLVAEKDRHSEWVGDGTGMLEWQYQRDCDYWYAYGPMKYEVTRTAIR